MHLGMDVWKPFIAAPDFGYPPTAIPAHSTVTRGPSWIEQIGDPLANLAFADSWRMVPEIIPTVRLSAHQTSGLTRLGTSAIAQKGW